MKAAILLSLARHPLSGKVVCSPNDLRALAIMKSLCKEYGQEHDIELKAVHAGDPSNPTLSEYLGYGLTKINVLKTTKNEDPCPKLAKYLLQEKPQLIVAGMQALGGLESGLVPYILANKINYPIISGAISISLQNDNLICSQYLPKGRRRDFVTTPPLFITVHIRAPNKPQFVWTQQQQGEIKKVSANTNTQNIRYKNKSIPSPINLIDDWSFAPAEKKRSRLSIGSNLSGFERMQRAVSLSGGGGKIVKDGSVLEKAEITYNMIKQNDVYSIQNKNSNKD